MSGGRTHWSVTRVLGDPALRLPLTWLVAAQLLDILTTLMGVARGLTELNPITLGVLHRLGWFGLFVPKVAVCCAALLAVAYLPRRTAVVVLWVFTLGMALVIASNVSLLVR